MNLVFAAAGALLGGMMFGFIGVVAGTFLGWLLGTVHDVRQRQGATEKELAWLRKSLAEHLQEAPDTASPAAPSAADAYTLPDILELEERDMLREPALPPEAVPPETTSRPLRELNSPRVSANPKPRPSYRPAEPEAPSPFEEWLGNLFSGENLLVKLGVVILFFGVSFLVKYAAQHGLFPLELRLTAAALGGLALLAVGWRLRNERPVYAQVIQGGGVGIVYLTTFAAMRLYHLIPTGAGFVFLVAICALAGTLSVLQEAPPLAVLGSAGGFLAPELASIGSGTPAMLFGYYALLNAGIVGIAWFRAWRGLNLLGFVCTFLVSASWGARFYHPDHFAAVEPFLVLFFLIYTAIPLLFAHRQPEGAQGYLDGTLVFGTPIVTFLLQAGLVRGYEYGLAWSALALGLFYLGLATILFRKAPPAMRFFAEASLAFGTVFATLAIPLAFDGRWTAAAWSVEGAALVWTGLRQERRLARGFGYLLLIGSGIAFLGEVGRPTGAWPVLNGVFCGSLLVCGAALLTARFLHRHADRLESWETGMEALLFAWGMAWWFGSGLHEIAGHTIPSWTNGAYLAFVALSCGVCGLLRPRLDWPLLEWPSLGLLPAMAAFAAYLLMTGESHPASQGCYLAWPLAFAVWYGILKAEEKRQPQLHAIAHAAALWLMAALLAWEINWQIGSRLAGMETWAMIAWGVVPALLTLLIVRYGERISWPVARHYPAYFGLGSGPLTLFANHGTVERIISFVVVGILLLVIGWFAPVPPRTGEGGAA